MKANIRKKAISILLAFFVFLSCVNLLSACAGNTKKTKALLALGEQEFTKAQLAGTDGLGRTVEPRGLSESGKYVGIFYFMWLGGDSQHDGIYDISKILESNPDLRYDTEKNPLWVLSGSQYYDPSISPESRYHYFEEPLYGYYQSKDPWVVRRHLELLSYAGVDFLYLDFTNAGWNGSEATVIYPEATYVLLDAILDLQSEGINVPKIVPMVCNPYTGNMMKCSKIVEDVYNKYYAKDNFKYKSCWFTADPERNPSGKPLIVTYNIHRNYFSNLDAYDTFWFKRVVWPTNVTSASYKDGFPWMDFTQPQENYDGVMNVSVAQHLSWSSEAYLAHGTGNTETKYRGRGATGDQVYAYQTGDEDAVRQGTNFEEQWARAINYEGDDEVWMVTVTGWNEWIARKLVQSETGNSYGVFVDTFSLAYSRDTEMTRDAEGYSDNFYMQLAKNIAKFKQKDDKNNLAVWKKTTVDYRNISSWDGVKAKYVDFTADAVNRDFNSVGSVYRYTDTSARNDIRYLKLANDEEYLYVLVEAKSLTERTADDKGWMNLYLSTGKEGGWESYNYVVNRSFAGDKVSIERLSTDSAGKICTETLSQQADIYVEGNCVSFRIPLSAIGVSSESEIQVKACDNIFGNVATSENDGVGCYEFGDVMAFYCGGDCAPIGRLNYAYRMA